MASSNYVDGELFLAGRHHARFSVDRRDYSGRPALDADLERRLREVHLEPARYGTRLFEALFPADDDLLNGYRSSLTLARHLGKRLRLRLHVADAAPPELHDLHWELLFDPKEKIALGRSRETAFSRYLGVSFEPGRPVTGRPRLLIVLACPNDLADYGLSEIDRVEVMRGLRQALSPLAELMTCEVLEGPASVERIRDRLVDGEFHALHLVAHGQLPLDEPGARLMLEAADGSADPVAEGPLAEVFGGQRNLRLISLIACHGGAPSGRDPFSGLAPALIRCGVPAVVAMRQQISLSGAMRFTEHFYRNLARDGRVDAATNEARLQLYLGELSSPEWGTPALFMRLVEGRLWRPPEDIEGDDSTDAEAGGDDVESRAATPVVKTLLASDLVDRARWTEELGDERIAEILRRHDRLARDLLRDHGGLEVDRAGHLLALFDRPLPAVRWALAFHQGMAELSEELEVELACRVAIHLAEVVLVETPPRDIARGANPLSVEGLARPHAARLMSLATGGQTLLSSTAFDLARRSAVGTVPDGELRWLAHGEYLLPEVTMPMAVFEVGLEGVAPLKAPAATEKVRRASGDRTIVGWRPGIGLEVPRRPHWVLEKKLSEGGFGEVWLASHEKLREQRVFKFCFEAERLRALQREITLFRLLKEELGDRDDIARILDWNFEKAPYFIESEYAADGDLLEWAKEQGGIGNVPMARRLEIIAQLATALSKAHSVAVLHKDVKPANVLIAGGADGAVQVRLADFGIGAITERERLEDAGFTVLGFTAKTKDESSSYSGTRLYMAPELLEGKPATLQADVYALGVMLYQIVIGDFERALAPGWRRDVGDELLREDIAFAVDGSPERRLANALRIAERLRSLEDRRQKLETERREREQAREAQAALERTQKRRKLMAEVIVALTLFAGAMVAQSFRVADAARNASREAEVAERVSRFMEELFEESDPAVARGGTVTAREMLDRGAERIRDELDDQPILQARLMDTMGRVYHNLGLYESAQVLLEEALELREQHLGDETLEVAASLVSLGDVYEVQGRYEEAELRYQRSLAIFGKVLGEEHPDLVASLNGLGVVYWRQGRFDEAEPLYRRAMRILEAAGRSEDAAMARTYNNLASLFSSQGRHPEAQPFYESALHILVRVKGPETPLVAKALQNLGTNHHYQQRYEQADSLYQRALNIREKILEPDHSAIGASLSNLASLRWAQERYDDAEALYLRSLEVKKKNFGSRHQTVAVGLHNLSEVYLIQSRYNEAEVKLRSAIDIFEEALGPDHIRTASALHNLATVLREQEKTDEAERLYRRALAIREKVLGPTASDSQETRRELAVLLRMIGREAEDEDLENRIETALPPE